MFRNNSYGQATLSFVLLIGGIIIEVAIAGSFVTYFLSASSLGERLSARALAAAEAGVRDAQIRISRDKDIGAMNFSLNVGSDSAAVTVTQNASDPSSFVYSIVSTGVASSRQRRLTAVVTADKVTGLVRFQSLTEQAIE